MSLKRHSTSSDLFNLTQDGIYFNTASFSPAFKSVEHAGLKAVSAKAYPHKRTASDLFKPVEEVKSLFAKIIEAEDPLRIVTIPSVSYGLATAANNIKLKKNDEILILEEQFPSNVYIWKSLADKYDATIVSVPQPHKEQHWTTEILNAISDKTAVVAIPQIHWANGIMLDLKLIREKTISHKALLIIDGSQSIGAMPFSVKDIQPDALIAAGYKWLFGPYGCAYAYYGPYFDGGQPIEENWANRLGSENLAGLTAYQSEYKPLAQRYQAGESASFVNIQMQKAALREIRNINPQYLQSFCYDISIKATEELTSIGYYSTPPEFRAKHLFGLKIPEGVDKNNLSAHLKSLGIHLSLRGVYLRVSCHLYNNEDQFSSLVEAIKSYSA